jgi:hypothetical protein
MKVKRLTVDTRQHPRRQYIGLRQCIWFGAVLPTDSHGAGMAGWGLSQIFVVNGMLITGREIAAPKVVERVDDSES